MSLTTAPRDKRSATSKQAGPDKSLQVSRYDRASGLIISLLVLVGAVVTILFVIWWTSELIVSKKPAPVQLVSPGGMDDSNEKAAGDADEPDLQELPEISEPQIETTLEAMTDVLTATAGSIDSLREAGEMVGDGVIGDRRKAGPIGDSDSDAIPAWERWEIHFTTDGIDAYARQLDYFKIELGVLGGGSSTVEYAKNFCSTNEKRIGKPADEKRIYMAWQNSQGPLAALDRQLLERAGVAVGRRTVLQFLEPETTSLLADVESASATAKGHTDPLEFLKTTFGVRPKGSGFEFYVIDQYFRTPPN